MLSTVSSHSQMRCAKYDMATGNCYAPIRNQASSFLQEAYSFYNGAAICQSPWTNPIASSYGNGAGCPDWAPCPDAMGNFATGETFTVMWLARNHAVADQSPATVYLYLSPIENPNQSQDVPQSVMQSNLICSGPYMNCNGQNGNLVQCYLTCTMPRNIASGVYTLWWKWDWQNGAMYTTCADINVSASGSSGSGSGSGSTPPASVTTGKRVITTGKQAITTGNQVITTGKQAITTGRSANPQATTAKSTTAKITTGKITTGAGNSPSPVTTGLSVVNPGSHSNCAGLSRASISQAVMLTVDVWGSGASAQFRAVMEVHVQEATLSNWILEFVFPSSQVQPHLNVALNGGILKCESTTPYAHAVIQPNSWVATVASGTVVTIEVLGTNRAGLSAASIIANTVLKVYILN